MKHRAQLREFLENPDDLSLEVWVQQLSAYGVDAMVHAAIASTENSLALLPSSPWIAEGCRPLLDSAEAWLRSRSEESAKDAAQWVIRSDQLAATAAAKSTEPGDWRSREAVYMCALIPAAIALDAGTMEPNSDIQGPPPRELHAACIYFSYFPNRSPGDTLPAIRQRLLEVWDPKAGTQQG